MGASLSSYDAGGVRPRSYRPVQYPIEDLADPRFCTAAVPAQTLGATGSIMPGTPPAAVATIVTEARSPGGNHQDIDARRTSSSPRTAGRRPPRLATGQAP
jgi:hypothetical protein